MTTRYGPRVLAAVLALAASTPATFAQTLAPNPVTVTDFAPDTLDGTAKTTTATMSDFSITDTAGAGWHVTVGATRFQEFDIATGQYVSGGKALPAGSLTMPAPTVTPAAGITIPAGPYFIDGATVQLASAATGTTGTYDFSQGGPLTLTLPANAYARTYRSKVAPSPSPTAPDRGATVAPFLPGEVRPMRTTRLLLVLMWLLVPPAAGLALAQEGGVTFAVEPAPGSSTAPRGGYFLIHTTPGGQVTQAISLRNDSAGRLELRLAVVDAVTGQLGGASYSLGTDTPTRTGAWITLDRTSLTLEPKASATVSFRITVPPGADSGEHLAGISVAAPTEQGTSGTAPEGQAGASVDVQTRRIMAVQVNLPGPSDPELVVTGVSPAARPDGLYLEIGLSNRGRGLTKGEGTVILPDEGFERTFPIDTFVPGTSIAYPIKWADRSEDGDYRARVDVRYGERVAEWEGTFTVGRALQDELAERQVQPARQGDSGGGIPLAALAAAMAAGGAIAAGGVVAFTRLRGRGGHR